MPSGDALLGSAFDGQAMDSTGDFTTMFEKFVSALALVLRERVEAVILSHMDVVAWDHSRAIEDAELESMEGYFNNIASILQQASKYEAQP